MQAQKAEGTRDLIGAEMRAWQKMQQIAAGVFEPFGFKPIETPAIEQVDVFVHGIGQSTDVVRKEMFRVFSGANLERVFTEGTDTKLKPKQRLALRPEGTAGVVRAVVENNLVPQGSTPFKAYYAEAMFRGERPQKGRLRQFHQVGIEWLGAPDPAADAECIIMLMEFYKRLGFDLSKLRLLINSMGDAQCRPAYREQVKQFILDHADEMCDECRERAELNPLRAFDCKNDHCREIMAEAPLMGDNLCDECREHYEQVKRYLDAAGIEYVEDPTLVRGLDYYTGTVYETTMLDHPEIGSICSGGRYDNLAEYYTNKQLPGVGISIGLTRLFFVLEDQGYLNAALNTAPADALILPMTEDLAPAISLATLLRASTLTSHRTAISITLTCRTTFTLWSGRTISVTIRTTLSIISIAIRKSFFSATEITVSSVISTTIVTA